jgi:signal transduction histidine kinase
MSPDRYLPPERPSRAASIAVSAALVAVWGTLRLVVFDTTMFPLTYALPLLVCVWMRDRVALWTMAAIFVVFHALKLFWIVPPGAFSSEELWTNFGATLTNITVSVFAILLILRLRDRLEAALDDVREQADELRTQGEELAAQNEELTAQSEELSSQSEELAAQNEELQSQTEEIGALNEALARREQLLETLLDVARAAPAEGVALDHIARAALDLFGHGAVGAAIYERDRGDLVRRACATSGTGAGDVVLPAAALVEVVAEQNRTAAIDDLSLRPDFVPAGALSSGAVLAAPIPSGERPAGVFVVYAQSQRHWSEEEFRLAEWLAGHCGRILMALRLQAALRESDRRKGEFLAMLSHELRNPLAPMRYALALLESGRADEGKALPILKRQFQQLVRLVDDLLDATRLSSNKIQIRKSRVDLAGIVRHAVDGCRPHLTGAQHRLSLTVPAAPVWVDADAARIAQVVTNLVNNAIRYTPAGGSVSVSILEGPTEVTLSVADTGLGLEAGDLERVFEMFTQIGPGSDGLGIGLALVRAIVEQHGGRVEARSEGLARGSEFRVTLARAPQPVEGDLAPAPASPPGVPRRVLVVDDNADAASMIAVLLEQYGHQVRVAHDGETALLACREFQAEVALLDIGLPGMDGYILARRLRDVHDGALRLVALTGWGQHADRERARAAGFDAHLTKPADVQAVLDVLQ